MYADITIYTVKLKVIHVHAAVLALSPSHSMDYLIPGIEGVEFRFPSAGLFLF